MAPNITYSHRKDLLNRQDHGISLAQAKHFDFDTSLVFEDLSQDHGETLLIATGFLNALLFVLIYTEKGENEVRAISLREAEQSEYETYAEFA